MPLSEVAKLNTLSWDQVRRMEMAYMERLLKAHLPAEHLRAVGIDEVSIRRGHTYQIVVADLDQQRPIWMGGDGRAEANMDRFFEHIGQERSKTIGLAVMDMWKPFHKSTIHNAPQARIVFDKFHVLRHLSDALDQVRRKEYKRVNDKERKFIKGQRYNLLSHKANLELESRRALHLLLKANKRLNTAYVLKESFAQLWDYNNATWARKFFENWKAQLKWQRLTPFERFADLVDRHWDGVASYCHPDNKVSLGFNGGVE